MVCEGLLITCFEGWCAVSESGSLECSGHAERSRWSVISNTQNACARSGPGGAP